jgi:hypothetical protein
LLPPVPNCLHVAGLRLPASLPAAALMAAFVLPGFVVKQVVNVIQLRTAAAQLVQYDQQKDGKKSSLRQ